MENKALDLKLCYIGGGSRAWAWDLMADLSLEPALGGTVALYDIDWVAARQNEMIGNKLHEKDGRWRYRAVQTLDGALTDADFVIISILPGTLDEMESDVHAPEQYGIYQSVGDTVGPGGILRAMRTLPMYDEIARAIRRVCPDAWVINYTNPMTVCVRYLYQVFPQIKAFGCCHEVFGTQRILARVVEDTLGEGRTVDRTKIETNVMGINHFTWIDKAYYRGMDIMPLYAAFCQTYQETGVPGLGARANVEAYFRCDNRVKFDLFLRYGVAAAAGDRHLAEFLPPWYLKTPETAQKWGFLLTPVSFRREQYRNRAQKSERLAHGELAFERKPSGEEGVRQIKALAGLGDFVTNVNLPNAGQIPNLPIGAVVETNVCFSHNNIRPLMAGTMPREIYALTIPHVCNQQAMAEATVNHSINEAFQVFLHDPMMNIAMDDARALFDEMMRRTERYLAWWKQ